jgi:hypothetical protein
MLHVSPARERCSKEEFLFKRESVPLLVFRIDREPGVDCQADKISGLNNTIQLRP